MWKWIKSIFKKKSNPSTVSNSLNPIDEAIKNPKPLGPIGEKTSKVKKIAIIIGHGHGDSGAESWDKKRNEFEYNSIVANLIKERVKTKEIKLFWRDQRGISGVSGDVAKWDDDLSLELHCNSADNPTAKGCEILCLGTDKEAVRIAQDLASKFCKKFNRVKRDEDGVRELKKKDRGHYSLSLVDDGKPSILIEPFFINNPNEWIDPLVIAEFLIEFLEGI